MSRLAKYNALSAEIKRCEREQAFLGYGGGELDPRFVGTMKFGDDDDGDFSDDDGDDLDVEEYPSPPVFTPEEEMERLEKTLGVVVVDDKSEETEGDWDDEYLENHEQPRNITDEHLEEMLRGFKPTSYIPAVDDDGEKEPDISYDRWPI